MSVVIEFGFPAGRYHATPWGRSVNEADVEWPPSPWRILRALVAMWHRKTDAGRFPEELLERLIEKLAATPPRYVLPQAVRTHTRHYMPVQSGSASSQVLIFDAFAGVDPSDRLTVEWPDVALDEDEYSLLSELIEKLGYLGRAESWVEARLVEQAPTANCVRADSGIRADREPVRVLAPLSAERYAEWRSNEIGRLGLSGRGLRAKDKRLLATMPERLLDSLRLETFDLQHVRWSSPPAARELLYERPRDCLAPRPRFASTETPTRVTTVRLALAGKPLPLIEDALRIGEAVRYAAMKQAERRAQMRGVGAATVEADVPSVLSGHDLPADNRHGHAFYLPEDADLDGRIDHILVHAPAGLPWEAVKALGVIPRIWIRDGTTWNSVLEGEWAEPSQAPSVYVGAGTVWTSATPYLHPWFAKKRFGVADQILRECRERGLPAPAVEYLAEITIRGRPRRPIHFHRFRSKRGGKQPDTHGQFLRLTFPEPIRGPLALGFACHYGLGTFQRESVGPHR